MVNLFLRDQVADRLVRVFAAYSVSIVRLCSQGTGTAKRRQVAAGSQEPGSWELQRPLKPRLGRGRKRADPEVKLRVERGSKIRRQMDSVTGTSERIGPRCESQPGVKVLTSC